MKLQILVPQYQDGDDIIKLLLDSIALQKCIDFNDVGVIVCNDGSNVKLSKELLESYPFKIEYYWNDIHSISKARNICLEKSTADYVMFANIDDMFYNACGLYIIFNEMSKGRFDILTSVFKEETMDKFRNKILVDRDMDPTFIYGKVYRRQYLLDNNIRFNESLKFYDDVYFNILAQNSTSNVKYCATPFYLWCWRDGAVFRHKPGFTLETYDHLLDSYNALIEEFDKRGKLDKVNYYVSYMFLHTYYSMNKPEWVDVKNKAYRTDVEKKFENYYKKYKGIWNKIDTVSKMQVSNMVRGRVIGEGMLMESITITDWLKKFE